MKNPYCKKTIFFVHLDFIGIRDVVGLFYTFRINNEPSFC